MCEHITADTDTKPHLSLFPLLSKSVNNKVHDVLGALIASLGHAFYDGFPEGQKSDPLGKNNTQVELNVHVGTAS